MSRRDDDQVEMNADENVEAAGRGTTTDRPVADPDLAADVDLAADAAESSELVTRFLADLRAFADGPVPAPSADLIAAFAGASPLAARRLARRRATAAAAAAVAVLGLTGVAAAQNRLPDPAQRLVSRVVELLTPFALDPADRVAPRPTVPAVPPVPPSSDAPTAVPGGAVATVPVPARTSVPEGSDDEGPAGSGEGTDDRTDSGSGDDSGERSGYTGSDSGSSDSSGSGSDSGDSERSGGAETESRTGSDGSEQSSSAPRSDAPESDASSGSDTSTSDGGSSQDGTATRSPASDD